MKTRLIKSLLAIVLTLISLPMLGQDFMNVFFKDGTFRKFYMKNVTEIVTSKFDADGVQHGDFDYQHVTTIYEKYVYSLEDVDSITFTKIDEEKAEQNFVSAMPNVFSVIEDCETIEDVDRKIDQIKNIEGVADAWSDGHQLYVAIAEGEVFSFHYNHDVTTDKSVEEFTSQVRALKPRLANVVKLDGSPLRAVIANQRHYDEQMSIIIQQFSNVLIHNLEECGIQVDYVEDPTVDFFYDNSDDPKRFHLYDYDIILLITHGGYSPILTYYKLGYLGIGWSEQLNLKAHSFETSEVITIKESINNDEDWWADNYKKFERWRDKTSYHDLTDVDINYTFQNEVRDGKNVWVAHPVLTEYFFMDIAKGKFKNPNSILFSSACQSLKGDNNKPSYSFANILFKNRNLGIYGGYTESNYFGPVAGPLLYSLLLAGVSIDKGISDHLYDWLKIESLQNILKDEENFIRMIDQDNLMLFKNKKKRLNNAELRIFDKTGNTPNAFFLFPTRTIKADNNLINQEFASKKTATIEGYVTYLEVTNIETGFEFGDNPDLGPENGICESVKKEMVNNENGKYRIELTISNLAQDKTYYYRAYTFDGKSFNYGNTYSFSIAKPIDIPAEPIDLGLPSGTLWASYNVGATKPEEYGGYYAWGETEQKETCGWKNYTHCNGSKDTCFDLGSDISGTKYDVAHAKWGGEWHLPTLDQVKELMNKCTSTWTTVSGVNGLLFTGPNGKTVFFPAAGYLGNIVSNSGSYGYYWSGGQDPKNAERAYNLSVMNGDPAWLNNYRYAGFSVRPVMPGLKLSKYGTLCIMEGKSEVITIETGSGSYLYGVDNRDVVSVNVSETTVTFFALKEGTATVTLSDKKTNKTATITVVVGAPPIAVDMGLPSGTKWANYNLGATKPEDYGEYYAWGEIEIKEVYNNVNYQHSSGTDSNGDGLYDDNEYYHSIGSSICGTEYDVVHVKWGGAWQMPTVDQCDELIKNCIYSWTEMNGVKGGKFTSKINGNSIFMPAAGGYAPERSSNGTDGWYWSGTSSPDRYAWSIHFLSDAAVRHGYLRFLGFSVRPVMHSTPTYDDLVLSTYDPINMNVNAGATFMILSGSGSYAVESSDETVVSVKLRDNYVDVLGEAAGTAIITISDTKSGQKKTIEVTIIDNTPPPGTHALVIDLGLPSGTLWADRNVGASSPEDYGGLYSWAMTEEVVPYGRYKWGHGEYGEITKYCTDSKYGIVDNKTVLDPEDDAAYVAWSGQWLMPTLEQAKELVANCDSEWTTLNGVRGRKYTSKINGNTIFFPAAGYFAYETYYSKGTNGFYWTSTLSDNNSERAYNLFLASGSTGTSSNFRYYGASVRPVTK